MDSQTIENIKKLNQIKNTIDTLTKTKESLEKQIEESLSEELKTQKTFIVENIVAKFTSTITYDLSKEGLETLKSQYDYSTKFWTVKPNMKEVRSLSNMDPYIVPKVGKTKIALTEAVNVEDVSLKG